jgi:hypothetical protein
MYDSRVKQLKECDPSGWWKEIKKLSGMSAVSRDSTVSILQHVVCDPVEPTPVNIAKVINNAFLASMSDFSPLSPNVRLATDSEPPFTVTEQSVFSEIVSTKSNQSNWARWYSLLTFKRERRYFCTTSNVDY